MLTRDEGVTAQAWDKGKWLMRVGAVAAVIGVLALIGKVAGENDQSRFTPTDSQPAAASPIQDVGKRTVLMEFDGTADSLDLTMSVGDGDTSQQTGVDVPLTRKSTGERGLEFELASGTWVYISGQNTGARGSLTCRITVDGVVFKETTSSGAYVIATCSGRIP